MERHAISILHPDGEATVHALCTAHFGVHQMLQSNGLFALDYYSITHLPSGYSLGWVFMCEEHGVAAAEALEPLCDWASFVPRQAGAAFVRCVADILRRQGGERAPTQEDVQAASRKALANFQLGRNGFEPAP